MNNRPTDAILDALMASRDTKLVAYIAGLENQRDDLLAACEAARSAIGGGNRFLNNDEMLALDLLDAAIAKARGGGE